MTFNVPGIGACLLAATTLFSVASPRAQAAESHVPRIHKRDLPVARTCAPLGAPVTHVMVGQVTAFDWFRVLGVKGEIDFDRLKVVLKERAAQHVPADPTAPNPMGVWITASRRHRWGHVVKVLEACQKAGLYRVGLRVRHPDTGEVYGFPVFLPVPSGDAGAAVGEATQVQVRLQTIVDPALVAADTPRLDASDEAPLGASNPALALVAARRAVERYGDVVATARIATNAQLQDAITLIDSLYLAGCRAVRLPIRMLAASPKVQVVPVLWFEGVALGGAASGSPQAPPMPPSPPRAAPWPVSGANMPGWERLVLREAGATPTQEPDGLRGQGLAVGKISAFQRERAQAAIIEDTHALAAAVEQTLGGGAQLTGHLGASLRDPSAAALFLERLRTDAEGLARPTFSSLRCFVTLWEGENKRGTLDVLLSLAQERARVVSVRQSSLGTGAKAHRMDEGVARELRTMLEAELLALRGRGAVAIDWAELDPLLRLFPEPAHAGLRALFEGRAAMQTGLDRTVGRMTFDRITVHLRQAWLALFEGDQVGAVGQVALATEGGAFRIRALKIKREGRAQN